MPSWLDMPKHTPGWSGIESHSHPSGIENDFPFVIFTKVWSFVSFVVNRAFFTSRCHNNIQASSLAKRALPMPTRWKAANTRCAATIGSLLLELDASLACQVSEACMVLLGCHLRAHNRSSGGTPQLQPALPSQPRLCHEPRGSCLHRRRLATFLKKRACFT